MMGLEMLVAAAPVALGGALGGIAVLRLSWGRAGRSPALNLMGWGMISASLVAGWLASGAWGVAVAALWVMIAAFIALAWAAKAAPSGRRKPSNRRVGMLPVADEPLGIWRRVATFLLVVPGAMAASVALAVAARWLALLMGTGEANANVLALFVAPVGWTVLAFLILMSAGRRRQMVLLAVAIATALPAAMMGAAA